MVLAAFLFRLCFFSIQFHSNFVKIPFFSGSLSVFNFVLALNIVKRLLGMLNDFDKQVNAPRDTQDHS